MKRIESQQKLAGASRDSVRFSKLVAIALIMIVIGACRSVTTDNLLVLDRGANKDQWWSELPRESWQQFERIAHAQPWFEVYRVADGVIAIYEPGQFEEVISYLIVGRDRALLFDTGLGIGDISELVKELTNLPVAVLNSHSHYDHIGGNYAFTDVLGVNSAYSTDRANGLTNEQVAEFVGPGWIWKPTPADFNPDRYAIAKFAVSDYVEDGQVIDLGGRSLEVLLTPGHAPDSLCLLDRENRLLFSGDTFYLAPLYVHLPGSDFAQFKATANRLAALQDSVGLIMPGHNEPAIEGSHLAALLAATQAISDGYNYVLSDNNREYDFGEFSIVTTDADQTSR